jgi:hypothetical protein
MMNLRVSLKYGFLAYISLRIRGPGVRNLPVFLPTVAGRYKPLFLMLLRGGKIAMNNFHSIAKALLPGGLDLSMLDGAGRVVGGIA